MQQGGLQRRDEERMLFSGSAKKSSGLGTSLLLYTKGRNALSDLLLLTTCFETVKTVDKAITLVASRCAYLCICRLVAKRGIRVTGRVLSKLPATLIRCELARKNVTGDASGIFRTSP